MHCTIMRAGSKTRILKANHHDADASRPLHTELSTHFTGPRDARYYSKGADGTGIDEDDGYPRSERVTHVVKEC